MWTFLKNAKISEILKKTAKIIEHIEKNTHISENCEKVQQMNFQKKMQK